MTDSSPAGSQKPRIDTTVPHSARVWNYWLGGKDNYPVDRAMGEQILAMVPDMPRIANTSETFNEAAPHSGWYHVRSPEQIAGFFAGLELVEPGVVSLARWRPQATPFPEQDGRARHVRGGAQTIDS